MTTNVYAHDEAKFKLVFGKKCTVNEEGIIIDLLKSPPGTVRVEILAKNLTKKELESKYGAVNINLSDGSYTMIDQNQLDE